MTDQTDPTTPETGHQAPEHDVPPVTTTGEDTTSAPEPVTDDQAPAAGAADGAAEQREQDADSTPEDTPDPADGTSDDEAGTEDQDAEQDDDGTDEDEQDTPEPHADPRVRKARAEAAKYRTRAREAETTLSTVTAERDALQARLDGIEHDRMATDACRAAHLPESMASRLTGTTADDLTADARAISEAMGYDRGPVDPSQGRSAGGTGGTGDDGSLTWADVLGTGNNDL